MNIELPNLVGVCAARCSVTSFAPLKAQLVNHAGRSRFPEIENGPAVHPRRSVFLLPGEESSAIWCAEEGERADRDSGSAARTFHSLRGLPLVGSTNVRERGPTAALPLRLLEEPRSDVDGLGRRPVRRLP